MATLQLTDKQIVNALDNIYDKVTNGLPGMPTCQDMAYDYINKYPDIETAVKKFVKWQIAKCTTAGFMANIGGFITLPVAIPANLTAVWYVQLRMIATIATMAGYDPSDDEVQTLAYICLTGSSVAEVCKKAGVDFAQKLVMANLKRIPGEVLKKINQIVGFRFITRAGTTGVINLTKMVPLVGGVVGGSIDFVTTKSIADHAYKVFVLEDLD